MKLIIAVLLVISARVQGVPYNEATGWMETTWLRECNAVDYEAVRNGSTNTYNCLGRLDTHGVDEFKTRCEDAIAYMGPCANTVGCNMSDCCGIISGVQSYFAVSMTSVCDVEKGAGYFSGWLQAVKVPLGNTSEVRVQTLPLTGVILPVGGYAAQYENDPCISIGCPKKKGDPQFLKLPFKFPLKALTTFTVKADFVAKFESKNCPNGTNPYCILGLNARLVNADLANGLKRIVESPIDGLKEFVAFDAADPIFNLLGG